MNSWLLGAPAKPRGDDVDPEIMEEAAIAMAQATLHKAMVSCGLSRAELARRMNRPRSFITKMLSGDHNLTVRTFARALAACGYEPVFAYEPVSWSWPASESEQETATSFVRLTAGQHLRGAVPAVDHPIAA